MRHFICTSHWPSSWQPAFEVRTMHCHHTNEGVIPAREILIILIVPGFDFDDLHLRLPNVQA